MKDVWTAVDQYFEEKLVPADEALEAALKASREAGLPAIDVTPLQGRMLELLVRMTGARRVLEVGTLGGYSTIWLARAVAEDGVVISLEIDAHHAEVARGNLRRAGLHGRVDVRVGPALEGLEAMVDGDAEPFDVIFIDADKPGYPEYLTWALKLARPGTVIVADNVVRDGKVIEANSRDANVQGVRQFTEMVAAEPRLSATAMQGVGKKGYDGFVLAVVLR